MTYSNMQSVDVVVLTRNSEKTIGKCLDSIVKNVPLNRLIIVDGNSTDTTLDAINRFGSKHANIRIIKSNGTRGAARQTGTENVTTEWFMFVDSDVILCEDWFKKASAYVRDGVGAIWGLDIPGDVRNAFLIRILGWMENRVFGIRGGCHDILIRREAVRDIRIPARLHTLEDAYIKEWIVSRGFSVVTDSLAYCRHYKSTGELFSWENSLSVLRELGKIHLMKERLIYAAFFALVWLVGKKD